MLSNFVIVIKMADKFVLFKSHAILCKIYVINKFNSIMITKIV